MKSLYEQRESVMRLIDRGEWKHSWHLPRTSSGIDWWHADTIKRVKDEREAAIRQANALLTLALSIEIPEVRHESEEYIP